MKSFDEKIAYWSMLIAKSIIESKFVDLEYISDIISVHINLAIDDLLKDSIGDIEQKLIEAKILYNKKDNGSNKEKEINEIVRLKSELKKQNLLQSKNEDYVKYIKLKEFMREKNGKLLDEFFKIIDIDRESQRERIKVTNIKVSDKITQEFYYCQCGGIITVKIEKPKNIVGKVTVGCCNKCEKKYDYSFLKCNFAFVE